MLALAALAVSLAFYPLIVFGFSFSINNTPQQCQNLSISISGSGQPPYRAVVVPSGPTPLPNNVEVRKILDLPFPGNSSTLSFQLKYPENSQFVVVVSDSSGFGTGGTSTAAQVQTGSSDTSCFGDTQVSPAFSFSTDPANQLVQCSPIRIYWDPTNASGVVDVFAVIPGGQSTEINQGTLTTVANEGLGFNWPVPIRVGTTVMLLVGDSRGIGSAGSVQQNVQQGESAINNTCLNASSPSSTPGSPAGGAYPTGSNGAGTGGNSGSGSGSGNGNNNGSGGSSSGKSNTGAIVGGVVGGVVALIAIVLVCLFCLRRRRLDAKGKTHTSVDLFHVDNEDGTPNGGDLPQFYQPEPFMVPDPTVASSNGHERNESFDRRQSSQTATSTDFLRGGTPEPHGLGAAGTTSGSTQTRKSPLGPAQLRPVNIIQHDDAGDGIEGEQETIELPPAYTHIRKPRGATTTTDDNTNNEVNPSSST
ncbi:hypothetical protein PILCRDRAFT_816050 [Piloderma croceum F 1598]|uniref:Mid2 domain-containing protein n=1 Tax=Piloderma croceum (strain F 1598) TaxID=765440 RepID=A0A0C3G812_PILCF|nr:hypothetical protein PILCRDRAFT_816050 [Piloderma croceum F 1598]